MININILSSKSSTAVILGFYKAEQDKENALVKVSKLFLDAGMESADELRRATKSDQEKGLGKAYDMCFAIAYNMLPLSVRTARENVESKSTDVVKGELNSRGREQTIAEWMKQPASSVGNLRRKMETLFAERAELDQQIARLELVEEGDLDAIAELDAGIAKAAIDKAYKAAAVGLQTALTKCLSTEVPIHKMHKQAAVKIRAVMKQLDIAEK